MNNASAEIIGLGKLNNAIIEQMVGLTKALHKVDPSEQKDDSVFVGGENEVVGKILIKSVAKLRRRRTG